MSKSKHINRRSFLTRSIAGAGVIGGLGLKNNWAAYADPKSSQTGKNMILRTLGKTGLRIPVVSMGVMNADIPEVLAESYNQGVRHFDTAWNYQRGRNEEMVGDVIKALNVRDQVVIATKILLSDSAKTGKEKKEMFMERFEQSMARLKMDYVDILYLHDVTTVDQIRVPEIQDAFRELKDKGKIQHAGFSTHRNMTEVIREAMKTDIWEVVLTAYNFAMSDDAELTAVLQKASKKGIGLVAMKTQAGGGWWRNWGQKSDKFKGSLNQTAMLKWVLQHPFITTAIPGYTNFEHMEEDLSVGYDLAYSNDEEKFLKDRNIKLSLGFCRQCQQCVATCPNQVDIPTLMRVHMYLYQYRNTEHAYAVYQDIDNKRSLSRCRSCGSCTASCTNTVSVPAKINDLKQLNLV